jgi:hypothetical protein
MSSRSNRTYRGVVRKGAVILGEDFDLPEGTPVEVRPELATRGTPGAILAAAKAPPHVDETAVDELMGKIAEGRRPVRFDSALD